MKEIWICLCGQQHSSQPTAMNPNIGRNPYTECYQCENCGATHYGYAYKEKEMKDYSLFDET